MTKAALYARVSTDAQKQEGTIKSQVLELKRQIAAAGHVLVKEYIDDGLSGTQLDRPGLDQMRRDIKTGVFEAIYFLDTDRIARDVAYQSIILSELLKHGKQIIIKGKDYVNNPENKFAVTVLGAVAELERAKIIERTSRGRLHKLRLGEMSSNGHRIYGYEYVKKTTDAPASLKINEEQAAVVREVFEMFASGKFGLVTICRNLEKRSILTYKGRSQWDNDRVESMLVNETYAGIRYFNRLTTDKSAAPESAKVIHGRFVNRDRAEWIGVSVPAIVSRELFDAVQERLRVHDQRYCRPPTHYLLGGLVQCGFCGARASSSRGWHRVPRPSGKVSVYHRAEYRCNRRAHENMHDRTRIKRCRNSSISTHILEGKVFEMIREIMLDPTKLRFCIDRGDALDDRSIGRRLSRLAGEIAGLEDERRRIIDQYAVEQTTGEAYIAANRNLDRQQEEFTRKKAELIAAMHSPQEDFVDASIRQFCATGNARLRVCTDFDTKRQFLGDHVERVIFNGYRITILGSVSVRSIAGETMLQFRIEGEISKMQVRANATRMTMEKQGRTPRFGRADTLSASNTI
jgi:site-specific DNA recombinase